MRLRSDMWSASGFGKHDSAGFGTLRLWMTHRLVAQVMLPGTLSVVWAAGLGSSTGGDGSELFYAPDKVQTIYLEIASDDLDRMHRALPERIYVAGSFRWNDQSLYPVGIRYRGGSSSMPESPYKRSFLVAFSEFKKGQRFLGLRNAALDNGIQFGSLFSECLITEVLRGVGVKASRCNHARVHLNGKPAGVFVNVERIDKSFLERHFGTATGVLFKVDESGPGADLRYVGSDPMLYRKAFELHLGSENPAFAALVELIRVINDPAVSAAELSRYMDMESFVKTTAVMLFAGAFDQYTGWGPHNYYLYLNPRDGRWTYIPWDLDVGFADNAFGRVPVLEGWHAAWPAPVPGRPLMERLVSDPGLLEQYRRQARSILETWFRPETLIPKLRAKYDQIRPALADDPYPARRATVPSDTGYSDILVSMEEFIRKRYVLAKQQLDSPGPRPAPKPAPAGPARDGPSPGPPSPDSPSDLRAVKVTPTSVELNWRDHAEGEVAFIVQRCVGAECGDFMNSIGRPGENITSAIDRDVQPGVTYRYRVYAVLPTPQGPRGTGVSNVITVSVPKE
ncbi:MAG TPA: CotH kinase family protein [Verrucomicrobiota bacterium]|nr:CotH kinase family protein [Verrucomicrobiota bacterium]